MLISFFRNPVATFQQPALSIRGSGPQLGWDTEICSLLAWVQGPIRYAADRTGTPCVVGLTGVIRVLDHKPCLWWKTQYVVSHWLRYGTNDIFPGNRVLCAIELAHPASRVIPITSTRCGRPSPPIGFPVAPSLLSAPVARQIKHLIACDSDAVVKCASHNPNDANLEWGAPHAATTFCRSYVIC